MQDDVAWPDDAVEVGRILGAWGVKGWVRIKPYAADPQALFSSKRWYSLPPQASGPVPKPSAALPLPAMLRVAQAREHGDDVVALFHDCDSRAAAEQLKGVRLFVPRSSFPTAGDDEFYWVDLIGCEVHNRHGEVLGTVSGLLETGPQCVLRIQGADAQRPECLVPFVSAFVDKVDLSARRIDVDWSLEF